MVEIATTQILTQTPCVALRPFVRRFMVVESTAIHGDTHLPDTSPVAAFRFQGDCRLDNGIQAPQAALTGLWDAVRTHAHSQDHAVVIVTFTATGAAALLRHPFHQFANATTDLAAVLGHSARVDNLAEQLVIAADHAARIRLVEAFLLRYVDKSRFDLDTAGAVALIEQNQAMLRIEELAQKIGLSQSALERRFHRQVGVSPRQFASLVRLKHVVQLREQGTDLTTIAHAAGYYDQAHFIRDFKRFTGLAPSAFFDRSPVN